MLKPLKQDKIILEVKLHEIIGLVFGFNIALFPFIVSFIEKEEKRLLKK